MNVFYLGIGLTVCGAVWISLRRRGRDLRVYLEPPLRSLGFEFISASPAGLLRTGPFPKVEWEEGPVTKVAGVQGEYCEYRIVSFRDAGGKVYRLWAQVEFEAFKFRRVRWRSESREGLPQAVLPLLEN